MCGHFSIVLFPQYFMWLYTYKTLPIQKVLLVSVPVPYARGRTLFNGVLSLMMPCAFCGLKPVSAGKLISDLSLHVWKMGGSLGKKAKKLKESNNDAAKTSGV